MFRKVIVAICIALAAGLMFTNIYIYIYISMVDARSWVSNIPLSVYTEREYFKTVNPGDFFRVFAPVLQFCLLLLLIAYWKSGAKMRWLCIAAFLISLGIDLLTFGYFYPRNDIMLHGTDLEKIRKAVHEWITMDKLRSALTLVNVVLCFTIQAKIYKKDIIKP